MINSMGAIQNNKTATDFITKIKNSKVQYKTLSKEAERELIESYCEPILDENGETILDTSTDEYNEWLDEEDINKKVIKYYNIPIKLNWKKDENELRELLTMHNIRSVFSIAKSYCQDTRDFDNMIAKGLYGLVYASNCFNLFKPILEDDDIKFKKPKIDETTGKYEPVKFITYAHSWIYKYIVDEFYTRDIIIDNNSISLQDKVKIKNSTDNNASMENYIEDMIAPDYSYKPKSIFEELSANDCSELCAKINDFIFTTDSLSADEKHILIETYYNHQTTKYISSKYNIDSKIIVSEKRKALNKLKDFLINDCKINNINDIM